LIIAQLILNGSRQSLLAACCTLLCFDGYFRPREIIDVKWNQLLRPRGDASKEFKHWGVVVAPGVSSAADRDDDELRSPAKFGQFDDTVILGDRVSDQAGRGAVRLLLECLDSFRPKGDLSQKRRIFSGFTLHDFEKLFKTAALAARMASLKATPHCCRHGGASEDYNLNLRTLADIQRHGRWLSKTSVLRNEKCGRLTRRVGKLSLSEVATAKRKAAALGAELPRALRKVLK